MAFLPIFHSPFPQPMQVQLHQAVPAFHQAAFQPAFHQVAFQPAFMQVTVNKPIQYVGCVIIANGRIGSYGKDIIMAFSHTKNAYDVLGGDISGNDDPLKCIKMLMSNFGIRINRHTKFVDTTNNSNGKRCRIYIVNLGNISASQLTQRIIYNPVLSGAYAHLNRFPLNGPTNTHTNVDSNGKPKAFLSFASKIMEIAKQP
jgi:hypothetical protein